MGVDTKAKLKGNILPEQILNFIRHKYDATASISVKKEKYGMIGEHEIRYDKGFIRYTTSGFISFKYNDTKRNLFYCKSNYNTIQDLEYYEKNGMIDLVEMVKSETTSISLGCWGSSVDIIKEITTHFGGWVDEDDSDDKDYYYIDKIEDSSIKPVIYVTMEDIYKKFGGVVAIK